MAIDAYSPCPGGTGKKIKFCCRNFAPELEKIERMIDGKQYEACLLHVENLEKKNPNRACLLATKVMLLRSFDRLDEARRTAEEFLHHHPTNPVALAEMAIVAASEESGRTAVALVQRALAAGGDETSIHVRVYDAIRVVARALVYDGDVLAAQAMLALQMSLHREDTEALHLMVRLNTSPEVPAVLKGFAELEPYPADKPWSGEFDEIAKLVHRAQWSLAAKRLASLAQQVGDEPYLWRQLAVIRAWAADTPGAIEALRKYASLDIPLDDAVEAEAIALAVAEDPLGDQVDLMRLTYAVTDADALAAQLRTSPRMFPDRDGAEAVIEQEGVVPKGAFMLLDRPMPATAAETTRESIPRPLARVLVFAADEEQPEPAGEEGAPGGAAGEPADERRPARMIVSGIRAGDVEPVKFSLAELAGGLLTAEPALERVGGVSVLKAELRRLWMVPKVAVMKQVQAWAVEAARDVVYRRFPTQPLGLLDGKTPQEAAADPAYQRRILAAILILQGWVDEAHIPVDLNMLRAQLGLPADGPIDPAGVGMARFPVCRLHRLIVERLTDDDLLVGWRRSLVYNLREPLRRFGRAIVERPSLAGHEERLRALEFLVRLSDDGDEALRLLEEGRRASQAAKQSCIQWDLLEIPVRVDRREPREITRLLEHVQRVHRREQGAMEAMLNVLARLGMLRPNGTIALPMPAADQAAPIVVPGGDMARPGELWVPDSQKPAEEKPGIWVPGDGP